VQKRLKELLTWPAIIVSAILAIGTFIAFFGFDVQTPVERLQSHIEIEQDFHDSTAKVVTELDRHSEDNEALLESLIRGECLENPRENLIRQGLIKKCTDLGIDRTER
jgi:hypothetical protein